MKPFFVKTLASTRENSPESQNVFQSRKRSTKEVGMCIYDMV
jgi:hypothetical protein